jgi:hypothetical protein
MSRSRSCFFGLHYTVNSQEAKKRAVKKPQKVVLLKRAVKRSVQLHYYVPLRVSLFGRSRSQSQSSYHKLEVRPKIS